MSKYRVYELAKEYNTTSKVIIDILNRNDIGAKNHMSCVEEEAKVVVARAFSRKLDADVIQKRENVNNNTPARNITLSQGANRPAGINENLPPQIKNESVRPDHEPRQQHHNNQQWQPKQGQSYMQNQQQPRNDRNVPGKTVQHKPNYPQQNAGQRPEQRNTAHNSNFTRNPNQQNFNRSSSQQFNQNTNRTATNQQTGSNFNRGNNQQPNNNNVFNRNANHQQANRNNNPPHVNNRPQFQNASKPGEMHANRFNNKPDARAQAAQDNSRKSERSEGGNQRPATQHRNTASQNNNFNKKHTKPQGANHYRGNNKNQTPAVPPAVAKAEPPKPKVVKLGEAITVKELAGKFGREVGEVIKKLMMLGVMATINQEIDIETAIVLGSEFDVVVEELPPEEDPTEIQEIEDAPESLLPRPPVVTVMGHVDHGKTSVLDAIRQSNVTSHEAGGITQHIGAYQVNYQGKKIVFLDTPGHEAFTAMRARGAQVTDIAILVVAADDGVMPQTIEAINHAKSAKVPIVVAINKMDRPGANPDRVKQQMTEYGLVSEEWGGDTIMVEVSAHTKSGLTDLLEMILLVAEMQELKANPNRAAVGTIIEAQLDKGRGPVATVLVQKGTLRIGDSIIAGTAFGKVRAMVNDRGDKVKKAEPATPVEVLGLSDVPQAGDSLFAVDEKTARAVAEKRVAKKRTEELQQSQKVSLDDLFKHIQDGKIKDLNIVIKADVQGSIEALRQALTALKNKEVRVNVVHYGVGAVNESDVMLASASNALIIAFNVRPDANVRKAAEAEKVDIRTYRVIYDAINDIEAAMTGMLAPEFKEVILGRAEVRKVISIPKAVVAGSYVLEGKITNSAQLRIIRNGVVVHEGVVEALRRFKDDVKEVATGFECGISVEKYRDIKEGDIIEAFAMEAVKPGNQG